MGGSGVKAMRYKRLSDMWFSLVVTFAPLFVVLALTGTINIEGIWNPSTLYLLNIHICVPKVFLYALGEMPWFLVNT